MWAQQVVNGLTTGVVYALMGMGFSMVWATARTMNFAYGVTYTLGAYVFVVVFSALAGGGALLHRLDHPEDFPPGALAAGWQEPQSLKEWSNLIANQLNYLTVQNFPWVRDKDFVESMEAYVRFGAHSLKSALGSSIKAQRFIKLVFILICKLRWKLKFFAWPIEFKLAKKFVTK